MCRGLKQKAKFHNMMDEQFVARITVGWGFIPSGVIDSCDFLNKKSSVDQ